MDDALEPAAREAGIRWDRTKDWRGKHGKHLGVVMGGADYPRRESRGS